MSERLTQNFGYYYTEKQNIINVSDKLPIFENGVIMGKAIDKLAEFEDFMEEVGAESLNELETCIVDLKQENQALKDRWQELKDLLMLFYTVGKTSGVNGFEVYNAILDKMQELEKQ